MDQSSPIIRNIQASVSLKQSILEDQSLLNQIQEVADIMVECFRKEGKVLFCGNGGSAADAQHLAAEFSGRYYYDRPPLFSEALHVNTSYLTAVANDYSFERIYERMVEAAGKKGDVLIGLSTSGNSANVCLALKKAKELGMETIALTGAGGGKLKDIANICIEIPSQDTPRIQECHMLIGHTLCEIVEAEIFPKKA
jgi:D-sedoheptulose 7-phosphate isomerase